MSTHQSGNIFAHYRLYDQQSSCIGDITISSRVRHKLGRNLIEPITVCWTTGYDEPTIHDCYIPAREKKRALSHGWGNDDGYGGIIAERVAIGNIIRLAKEEYKVGPRWIVLE